MVKEGKDVIKASQGHGLGKVSFQETILNIALSSYSNLIVINTAKWLLHSKWSWAGYSFST